MDGEARVPGGKLVVCDLDKRDGHSSGFDLAGDFFLEPDSALADIDAAVDGLPVESDVATIAAAIRSALPEGAPLLGFTPASVGTAVRRPLLPPPGWRALSWEVVHARTVSPRLSTPLDHTSEERRGGPRGVSNCNYR